jgi:uncharacterized protein
MTDFAIVFAVFALVVALLRLGLNLGLVMLMAGAVLGLAKGMAPFAIARSAFEGVSDWTGLSLVIAIALIMVLESILRQTGTLAALVASLQGLFGDNRAVMALMPAIIGILPSAGGARFSAPMVEESAQECRITPERKSFINYWFRHIWEYVSPLYPGFIMVAALSRIPMGTLFLATLPFTLTVLAAGVVYGFRDVERVDHQGPRNRRRDAWGAATGLSPILAVLVLVLALRVDIALSLVLVTGSLLLLHRFGAARTWRTIHASLSYKTLLLVVGVLAFKGVMEASGVVDTLPGFFSDLGIPLVLVLFALPFLVGLLTGITVAYVGITFPLLIPLMGGTPPDLGLLVFAYASGFAGVMFSPVHLCLVLTRDYFRADLSPIYRTMLVPEALVLLVAAAEMLLLSEGVLG